MQHYPLEMLHLVFERADPKKGYRSLNVGRSEAYTLIDSLRGLMPVVTACDAIGIPTSSYYDYRQRRDVIDVERLELRARVSAVFNQFRGASGSRTIVTKLQEVGVHIGRFKVMRLMEEAHLVCGQPGPHNYKVAKQGKRLIIPT
jgi:hypothetical protein